MKASSGRSWRRQSLPPCSASLMRKRASISLTGLPPSASSTRRAGSSAAPSYFCHSPSSSNRKLSIGALCTAAAAATGVAVSSGETGVEEQAPMIACAEVERDH
eukprot:5072518-Prymnesium_polylepis.1